jgi:flagellar motor switch protein FliM
MSDILSPDEIQALSEAVFDGKIEVEGPPIPSTHQIVEVDIISNDHLSFSEVSKSIPIPSWINLMQIEPLPGAPFLAFDTNLSMAIIDYLCGGKGKAVRETKKEEFGAIEQHLMAKVTSEAIECLEDVWRTIIPVKALPGEVEFDSRYITSVSQDEMFVVTYFSTRIEESSGVLILALPYTSLEPVKQKLTSTVNHDEQKINYSWLNHLREYIQQTEANITVEIGRKRLTIRDLLKMNIGDIITLDKFIGDELIVYVERVPKFKGYPGHYKGNNALNVTSIPFSSAKGETEDDRKNTPWQ